MKELEKISGKTHAEFKNIKTVPRNNSCTGANRKEACMTKNILTQYEAARHEREDVKKRIQETERQLSRIRKHAHRRRHCERRFRRKREDKS